MSRSRTGVLGLAVVAALALSGCSAGGGNATSHSSAGDSAPAAAQSYKATGLALTAPAAAGPKAAAVDPAGLQGRRQVRTADLGLRVEDVTAAAAKVRSIATSVQGFVSAERTSADSAPTPKPRSRPAGVPASVPDAGESVLTLRVPQVSLDRVMDQVAGLGDLVSRAQASTDVTTKYVDVASRLRTQRESVARVRVLLARATTIGQVVQVESELSRRQADLESLEAQLSALDDQTTLATLTVSLSPAPAAVAVASTPGAFAGGLGDGWRALVASIGVALTILGAVLPFAILAAVIGVPVMLVLRRRRTQPSV